LNNSSKKEFLCQAGLVLGSMWQLILTTSGSNVPLIMKQQHATISYRIVCLSAVLERLVPFTMRILDSPGSSNELLQMKLISLSFVFFAI